MSQGGGMRPVSQKDELISDLVYLRKGRGLTTGRLANASVLIEVCGIAGEQLEVIRHRLISAIQSVPDAENRKALLAAYGLGDDVASCSTLAERRAVYGGTVGRKYDTLAHREDAAIDELAIALLANYYAGAPLPAQLQLPHGGFLIEHLAVQTLYRDRRFVEHAQQRRVISLVEGAKGFEYHSNEPTEIQSCVGCRVETRYVPGGSVHRLLFPNPLARGEVHDFAFTEVSADSAQPHDLPKQDLAGQSFETPTLVFRQGIKFLGGGPAVIWEYDKLSRIERPGIPEDCRPLELDENGEQYSQFSQLYGGLCSGIAWRWNRV